MIEPEFQRELQAMVDKLQRILAVDDVADAYRRTGAEPIAGAWLYRKAGRWCACPVGVLALDKSPDDWHHPDWSPAGCLSVDYIEAAGLTATALTDSFARGFDGQPLDLERLAKEEGWSDEDENVEPLTFLHTAGHAWGRELRRRLEERGLRVRMAGLAEVAS